MEKLMAEMYVLLCSLHVDTSPATASTEEVTENSQTPQTTQSKHLTRYCSYSLTISNVLPYLYSTIRILIYNIGAFI